MSVVCVIFGQCGGSGEERRVGCVAVGRVYVQVRT